MKQIDFFFNFFYYEKTKIIILNIKKIFLQL